MGQSKYEPIDGSGKRYSMSTLPYPKEAIIGHVGGWELWKSRVPGTPSECTLWIGETSRGKAWMEETEVHQTSQNPQIH